MSRPLRILQSAPLPRPTTNPYIVMLCRSLAERPDLDLLHFSWRTALLSRFDVFHAHWPEILVSGAGPLKAAVRQALFVGFLAKLLLLRIPVVRTVHNLDVPPGLCAVQRLLLRLFDRLTVLRIHISDATPAQPGKECVTILHGHYRDWFSSFPPSPAVSGQLTYFGLIRPYKNVDGLLDAFAQTRPDEGLRLMVAGKPGSDPQALIERLDGDPRVASILRYLTDAELVQVVTAAELVVLPYREMHNSGAALAALSLDRPVLVPANETNRLLQQEAGTGWVHTYNGSLTPEILVNALHSTRTARAGHSPDLSRRGWARAGSEHVEAYRLALRLARG